MQALFPIVSRPHAALRIRRWVAPNDGPGLAIRQKISATGTVESVVVTAHYWIFSELQVQRGELCFEWHGGTQPVTSRSLHRFLPPRSIVRMRLHNALVTTTGSYQTHRKLQVTMVTVMGILILLFELDIRLSGGSQAFLGRGGAANSRPLRLLLIAHICVACATWLGWAAATRWALRQNGRGLPGPRSRLHRRFGWLVFTGVIATALSGLALYVFSFIYTSL